MIHSSNQSIKKNWFLKPVFCDVDMFPSEQSITKSIYVRLFSKFQEKCMSFVIDKILGVIENDPSILAFELE